MILENDIIEKNKKIYKNSSLNLDKITKKSEDKINELTNSINWSEHNSYESKYYILSKHPEIISKE